MTFDRQLPTIQYDQKVTIGVASRLWFADPAYKGS